MLSKNIIEKARNWLRLGKKVKEVNEVLKSSNRGTSWETVEYTFNHYKNTIIFPIAPDKNDLIMITSTTHNG